MSDPGAVEIDTSKLEAGIRALSDSIGRAIEPAALETATRIAADLRSMVPRRSGALANTVLATAEPGGAAVHYGGSLPYASYIDSRTGATEQATANAADTFHAACTAVAETAIRKL